MLDPTFVRDNIEAVRAGLRNRGLDPDKALEEIATLETARRRLIPELEGLKRQQNTSGDEIAQRQAAGPRHDADSGSQPRARAADQAARHSARRRSSTSATQALLVLPNLPHASVPVGTSAADNVEVRRHGEPRAFDFEPKPHWDLGRRARHHRLRARREDCRRAVLGAERRRRAAVARADQLHARPAHARARVPRGRAAVPREQPPR